MDAETRAKERNGAAVVRALGRIPDAEFRAHQLRVHDKPVGIATPYLLPDLDSADEVVERGVYDSIGVRLDIAMRSCSLRPSRAMSLLESCSICSNKFDASR